MLNLELDLSQLERVADAFDKAPAILLNRLEQAVGRGAGEIAREAKRNAPKAHSHLVNSIRVRREQDLARMIGPNMDYGAYVEQGSSPGGRPPRQTILDWIRVKGIQPNQPNMTQSSLAFVISRSIARKGTEAQPFMAPAAEDNRDRVHALVSNAINNALREAGL